MPRALRFDAPLSRDAAQAEADRLRADPDVEWVVVDEVLRPQATGPVYQGQAVFPNRDPAYGNQRWLQARAGFNDRAGLADFPAAWAKLVGRTLTPVTVAVLDSGSLYPADMDGRQWPGHDFVSSPTYSRDGDGLDPDPADPGDWLSAADIAANPQAYAASSGCAAHDSEWHGQNVGYVLGAITGNGLHGAGALAPLPGKVVLPVRVAGNCGAALSDIIEGMLWAAGVGYQGSPDVNPNPARVINLSFGSAGSCAETTVGSVSWLYQQTLASLRQKGTLVVASAGNGDPNTRQGLADATRPANCPGVLAVTGLNTQGFKAGYANLIDSAVQPYGVAVASGDNIFNSITKQWQLFDGNNGFSSLTNTGKQGPNTDPNAFLMSDLQVGTSFAAPQAAAVAALMLAVDPSLTVTDLLTRITGSALGFPLVSGYPSCSKNNTAHCNCSVATCGTGVLDAAQAVDSAIAHAALGGGSAAGGDVNSGFIPSRNGSGGTSTASSSGGGGAVSPWALAALVAAALFSLLARRRRA